MKCHITEKVSTIYASHISNTYTTCFEYTRVKEGTAETGETVETEVWGSCTERI